MAEKRTGLAPLPTGLLLRPTTQPKPIQPPIPAPAADPIATDPIRMVDEIAAGEKLEVEDEQSQGRGVGEQPARTGGTAVRTRRVKKAYSAAETKGRKLYLPDGIHDRLRLLAFSRREKVSTVAAEILDRNLPRLRIERDG